MDDQLLRMRAAGLVVAAALEAVRQAAVPGVTTGELDAIAEETIRSAGARPSFLEVPGYRHTLCVSVNEEVVHGIPGSRVLALGDLVSVDCGAVLDGWHGDSAISLFVGGEGAAPAGARAMSEATRDALWAGIGAFRVGASLGAIGGAVEDCVDAAAGRAGFEFGVIDGYTGHGIGREMHMDPDVYNYRVKGRQPVVRSGAVVAIEPMVTLGSGETRELADGWTVVSAEGGWAAHWEHTVATTDAGLWVLTAPDGGEAELTRRGLPFAPLA